MLVEKSSASPNTYKNKNRWLTFLSFFIVLNTLFFYGFIRDGTWLVIAILLVPVYYKLGRANFFLVSLSFLLVTLALIWVVDYGLPNFFYWRPYDRLISWDSTGSPIYKKNRAMNMIQPFGDLRGYANYDDVLEYEPRDMIFKTDSLGFRNDSDYLSQPFILVGDSFIAGTGVTQRHLLSSILKSRHEIDTYNMGVAGAGLKDYVAYTERLKNLNSNPFKVLIFVYEGNDFLVAENNKISKPQKLKDFYKKPLKAYKSFFRSTGLYRYTWIAYKSVRSRLKKDKFTRLRIVRMGNHLVGFHKYHIRESEKEKYLPNPILGKSLESIKDRIHHIFYIPTKYRVYYPLIEGRKKEPLPNANWEALSLIANKLKIPVTNLAPIFIQEAKKRYFENDQFIYWKDDNHWNINGITLTAQVVCQRVKELECGQKANKAIP
jgi:hypothetical protein